MTDIVERLRIFPHSTQQGHDLRHEAADEIDRLRAALKQIANDGKNCNDYCRRQAQRALGATEVE